MSFHNVFACLVHEKPKIILDLVRNLRALDPDSLILLYNGGRNDRLLDELPLARYGAIAHPVPQPQRWGWLHPFALDCMRFILANYTFNTLTIVDSDQLGVRQGYSHFLASYLEDQSDVGLLSSDPARQNRTTKIPPARTAQAEYQLWRPYLKRFPGGEQKFVHWTFWPATVITADACRDLVRTFDRDRQLQSLLNRTRIWASEEILIPTLVALLGYRVIANPCSNEFVQFRKTYQPRALQKAMQRPDTYWVHPVPRHTADPLRQLVREHFNDYAAAEKNSTPSADPPTSPYAATASRSLPSGGENMSENHAHAAPRLLLTLPILEQMRQVGGWLEEDEADLLIAATATALNDLSPPHAILEIGSYLGRSTVVLGSVVQALGADARVYAIDPHQGMVGAADRHLQRTSPTLDGFQRNIAAAGLTGVVELVLKHSYDVQWDGPISLLLIDGLHDYQNVSRDFHHFVQHIVEGGFVVFHDYASYYPGVRRFVDELLDGENFQRVALSRSLMVVRKTAPISGKPPTTPDIQRAAVAEAPADDSLQPAPTPNKLAVPEVINRSEPLISCLMPTYNRRAFVPFAIDYFQAQDYPHRELVILDDGSDAVADIIPSDDPRIRYERLPSRLTMGAKHNLGAELARGELIAHWDDDDWMAPWRLSYQVQALLDRQDVALCGLSTLYYYRPFTGEGWKYSYPQGRRPWVCGNTFCYRRSLWEQYNHPALNEGADTQYVWQLPARLVLPLENPRFLVALVHSHNTSQKRPSPPRWQPIPVKLLQTLVGSDWKRYHVLE